MTDIEFNYSLYKWESPDIEGGRRLRDNITNNKKKPKITIITAVLNSDKYLEECFDSIYNQTFKDFEHIVVDGGSTDNSIEIIKKYDNKIDYWFSKKDKGIYDAFNRGMSLASGQYIGFVNSDDKLTVDSLNLLNRYIENYPDKDFIFGAVKKHWGILYGYRPYKIKWSWGFYSSHSTGFFIKRSSAKTVGFYNLKYKYSSDYDYFYRMIVHHKMQGVGTRKEELFGIFRRGGFSSKVNFLSHFFEEITIRLDNKQNRLFVLLIFIYKYLKNISKI
tara:strand:- start:224 stop:1051 length:828 start_codon:yes stop_codon:yes gene_type:complete